MNLTVLRYRWWILTGLWLILSTALLLTCDIPKEIDFERYMSISQYIVTHHDYLVLHVYGNVYTDKPPLIFWLIALGWQVFGSMYYWWPYVLLCFFSGGSVVLTYHIAKLLYAEEKKVLELSFKAALFLFTLTFFGMATSELRVDTPLLCFSLLIHYGCLLLSIKNNRCGCIAIFFGIALGLFSKGPLIFVTGLLPALLGLWAAGKPIRGAWIALATLLGMIPILFWLIPACIKGGDVYTHDVLFGQIANRSSRNTESIAFYLARLPGYLFPFIVFPSMWRGFYSGLKNPAVRYAFAGIIVLLILFSLFGQKAMHYLLPTMPLWAIFLADAVKIGPHETRIVKVFLVVFAIMSLFMLFWQTGTGLQLLYHVTDYAYNFYLVTQSFYSWQLIALALFSLTSLVWLYKQPAALLTIIILMSVFLQINIQILNQTYFHARFYTYFRETIVELQKKNAVFHIQFSDAENRSDCRRQLAQDTLAVNNTDSAKQANYLISNQRCLFFNSRYWNAAPVTIFVPRIYCAYGIWEMNAETKALMQACDTRKQ